MTIATGLAEYCVDLSLADLDDKTVAYTKQLLFDTLGTAVGGYHWSDSADVMLATGRALDGGIGATEGLADGAANGTATVLATGEQLSPGTAAMVNGALSHSLDYDNRHSPGSLHIGSSVVTAALAAAETVDADGETLLEALVAGYDVTARLGRACNPRSSHERGFHPTGTCGTFGATAAVGVVYGLDADELVAAFGVNGSQASGSYQCSLTGGWNKRIHPGLAARNAFVAVAFATSGFEGPTAPIEGELGFLQAYADRPVPERATENLGTVYEAARTKVKPYPVGTFAHVPIALLIDLVTEEGLDPDDIESITIELPTSGAAMFGRDEGDGHPTSSADAQFDMPFSAALAVVYQEAGLTVFADALSADRHESFDRLMAVTQTVASDELESYLPERYPARVTLTTGEETYELFREWVQGEPEHPMMWEDLERKFADLAPPFDDDDRQQLIDRIHSLESTTGRALVDLFRNP